MTFWQQLKAIWTHHGTKVLGFGGAVLSTLSLIDRETINVIGETFGPKYGPVITHGFTIVGGLGVAYRGFKNSRPPQ
jgi:hypothetical protein